MITLKDEDYRKFRYTKIQVPIMLRECPSDWEDSAHYLDVHCDSLSQKNCFIGAREIEQIHIWRLQAAKSGTDIVPPRWTVEIVLAGVLREQEAYRLLDDLCETFSLACGKQNSLFQYSGLGEFTYRSSEIQRSYAGEDGVFGDRDFNHFCGYVESHTLNTLSENVFLLPKVFSPKPELTRKLEKAFLTAMYSRDAVSRYILLYYLFEILYDTEGYKKLEAAGKAAHPGEKGWVRRNRNHLLYQYLKEQFGITEYRHFDRCSLLTPEILGEIILTRNDLAHRADTSRVNEMMYHHLLPILQGVLGGK